MLLSVSDTQSGAWWNGWRERRIGAEFKPGKVQGREFCFYAEFYAHENRKHEQWSEMTTERERPEPGHPSRLGVCGRSYAAPTLSRFISTIGVNTCQKSPPP
jgi:hypothetical protein